MTKREEAQKWCDELFEKTTPLAAKLIKKAKELANKSKVIRRQRKERGEPEEEK